MTTAEAIVKTIDAFQPLILLCWILFIQRELNLTRRLVESQQRAILVLMEKVFSE